MQNCGYKLWLTVQNFRVQFHWSLLYPFNCFGNSEQKASGMLRNVSLESNENVNWRHFQNWISCFPNVSQQFSVNESITSDMLWINFRRQTDRKIDMVFFKCMATRRVEQKKLESFIETRKKEIAKIFVYLSNIDFKQSTYEMKFRNEQKPTRIRHGDSSISPPNCVFVWLGWNENSIETKRKSAKWWLWFHCGACVWVSRPRKGLKCSFSNKDRFK